MITEAEKISARSPRVTPEQAAIIRSAHHALDAAGRSKAGPHTATEYRRLLRELLDVLGDLTGITSASEVLPFGKQPVSKVLSNMLRDGGGQ
jgi:hypothetical protein